MASPAVFLPFPIEAERLVAEGDVIQSGQIVARVTCGNHWHDVASPVLGRFSVVKGGGVVIDDRVVIDVIVVDIEDLLGHPADLSN